MEEFQRETGQEFWLFTTEEFLKQARERLETPVTDETIEEARDSRESESRSYSRPVSHPSSNWLESNSVLQNFALGIANIQLPQISLMDELRKQYENPLWQIALGNSTSSLAGLGLSNLAANSLIDSMVTGPGIGHSSRPDGSADEPEMDEEFTEAKLEEDDLENQESADDEAHIDPAKE